MAVNLVLDNGNFPPLNANVLVAAGLRVGSLGVASGGDITAAGSITAGSGALTASELLARQTAKDANAVVAKSIDLQANPGSLNGVLDVRTSSDGTAWTDRTYFQGTDYRAVEAQIAQWSPLVNYDGVRNILVLYGTNTNPVGVYPNNVFYVSGGDGVPVLGVPPTQTPAPYPVTGGTLQNVTGGPTPTAGWVLANSNNTEQRFGGGPPAVVTGAGTAQIVYYDIGSYTPCQAVFFGGGGASIGAADNRGITLQQSASTTLQSLQGATLTVAGVVNMDGLAFQRTDQSVSPASSFFAYNNATPQARQNFVLGNNYTWTKQADPGTLYGWLEAAGTAGQSIITGGTNAAFDPDCMVFVSTQVALGAAKGILSVQAKTATSITIASRDATNALVAGDNSFFEWICFNPRWDTV
jgi:hypothetical protein